MSPDASNTNISAAAEHSLGRGNFIALTDQDSSDRRERLAQISAQIDEEKLEVVRVGFVDTHGIVRVRPIEARLFTQAARNGIAFTTALFAMDSANSIFQNVFSADGGFGREEMFVAPLVAAVRNARPETLRRTVTEVKRGIYVFDMLAPRFCAELLEEIDHFEGWCTENDLPLIRPNTMNNYGAVLDTFGFQGMLQHLMLQYVSPFAALFYSDVGGGSLDLWGAHGRDERTQFADSYRFGGHDLLQQWGDLVANRGPGGRDQMLVGSAGVPRRVALGITRVPIPIRHAAILRHQRGNTSANMPVTARH